jgi:hypothetical protein
LEDEADATWDEMLNVDINNGDEVLYYDSKENVHAGKVIDVERYTDRYTPPIYFYTIQKENGEIVESIEDEYVIKRKTTFLP